MRTLEEVTALALAAAVALATSVAQAQPAEQGELRGLKLGQRATVMATEKFGEFACGSNGSGPREPLTGWADFAKCRPEASGLREVYVRYDDRAEYQARAANDLLLAERLAGTKVAGHPVILSMLFDDGGVARGIRIVTDPRASPSERRLAHLLRLRIVERYGSEDWTCVDLPREPGESAVGNIFLKRNCEKVQPGRKIIMQERLLRKPGQSDFDPVTQEHTPGLFESSTRVEILDPALGG
jgi:hypothetical protein